jgi:hypothetical protein
MEFKAYTVEEFLSPADLELLSTSIHNFTEEQWNSATDHPFWKGRGINIADLKKFDRKAYSLVLYEVFPRIRAELIKKYNLETSIYPDTLALIRWPVGLFQNPHWDDMKGYGEEETKNGHRKFGTIVYLNDTYEGGQTYYPKFNHYITPKAGMLAMHPGDELHEHGVTEVKKSIRYTISCFWHYERARVADRSEFHDEYYANNGEVIHTSVE